MHGCWLAGLPSDVCVLCTLHRRLEVTPPGYTTGVQEDGKDNQMLALQGDED